MVGAPLNQGTTGRLQPGGVLQGRYIIQAKLGQGGMGAVYRAMDQRIPGKEWAVKEMDFSRISPQDLAQAKSAFQREARLLSSLSHPGLPRVVDYFEEGGNAYLVMDFIHGRTLDVELQAREGQVDEATVLTWADQLCDVLDYLHRQQPPIIFRDLKPGNVMLTPQGEIKLIDFGIARHFKPGMSKDTTPMGTPGYSPPEQYGKGQTDARADVYSLGAMLHQLLTGHDPGTTPFNLPLARSVNPRVSPQVEQTLQRALQIAPDARFQSVAEMRQALRQPSQPPPPPPNPLSHVPSFVWVVGGLLLLCLLAWGIGVAIDGGEDAPTPTWVARVTNTSVPTRTPVGASTPLPTPTRTPTWTPNPSPLPTHTPTRTPRPSPAPTATIDSDATVYDNFNNPAFDGAYNTDLWSSRISAGELNVEQRNGSLLFRASPQPATRDRVLSTRKPKLWQPGNLHLIEARLRLGHDRVGEFAFVKLALVSRWESAGWYTQCRLSDHYQAESPDFVCDVGGWAGNNVSGEFATAPIKVAYDTWYTALIDVNPENFELRFYLDGRHIGTYTPREAGRLRQSSFSIEVGVWQVQDSSVSGRIDRVRVWK